MNYIIQDSVLFMDIQILTFILMYLIIGNIVDNRRKSQKVLLLICEVLFAVCALLLGLTQKDPRSKDFEQIAGIAIIEHHVTYLMVGSGTGIIIISLLQIFHWFPPYALPGLMALWSLSEALGIILWIQIDFSKNWIKMVTIAVIFLLFAIIDQFTYTAYPAQLNIFIGDPRSETDRREMEKF